MKSAILWYSNRAQIAAIECKCVGQPRLIAYVLKPRTIMIERECNAADGNHMHECAQAHQLCDRVHMSDLAANFSFIKFVNPSFGPINT